MRGKLLLVAVPVLALIAAVVLVPSGSSATLPTTSTDFYGRVNQNGSNNVSTVVVNDATGTACCNAQVEALSGGEAAMTGAGMSAILVTFGPGSTGSVCLTDFEDPLPMTGVLLPKTGSASWTFTPRSGPVGPGVCGTSSLVAGASAATVNVTYASDLMSL